MTDKQMMVCAFMMAALLLIICIGFCIGLITQAVYWKNQAQLWKGYHAEFKEQNEKICQQWLDAKKDSGGTG